MTLFAFRGAKSHEWTFCDPINVELQESSEPGLEFSYTPAGESKLTNSTLAPSQPRSKLSPQGSQGFTGEGNNLRESAASTKAISAVSRRGAGNAVEGNNPGENTGAIKAMFLTTEARRKRRESESWGEAVAMKAMFFHHRDHRELRGNL